MRLALGDRLGPYEIELAIGSGGMGEVYRATDSRLRRTVAIKVLASPLGSDEDTRRTLQREARAVAALDHPFICAVYDIGRDRGVDYLVMPLIEGETLVDRIGRGPLPVLEALDCARQIADALAAAHAHGVIHRDVKPANIKLTPRGIKLLDFGIAAARSSSGPPMTTATGEAAVAGTVAYMAPEAFEGRTDERSDIFSLGTLLHELLTGRRAFAGDSAWHVAASILNVDPPLVSALRPGIPAQVDAVVARAMAKPPAARWQSAVEFRAALEACLSLPVSGVAVAAPRSEGPAGPPPRTWPIWATVVADATTSTVLVAAATPLLLIGDAGTIRFTLPLLAIGLLFAVAGVGVVLWRPWGRRAQQTLAVLGLLAFPFGTVLGAAALSYFGRPGVAFMFSGTAWSDLPEHQRARAHQDTVVPRRWMAYLPAMGAAALVPTILLATIITPSLLLSRVSANEDAAVGNIKALLAAEAVVARYNQGFFVPAECLLSPRVCLPGYVGGELVNAGAFSNEVIHGYRWQLHSGARLDPAVLAGTSASPQSLQSVAITMVPNEPGQTGVKSFCGDTTGQVCYVPEGLIRVVGGRCGECQPVR
jgi:hypothetical protein